MIYDAVDSFGGSAYDSGQNFARNNCSAVGSPNVWVTINTGTPSGAGTDANVYMYIQGDRGSTPWTRLNGKISGNGFENGDSDRVLFDLSRVGIPLWVCIYHDGSYAGPDWFLESVVVGTQTMPFNEWLSGGDVHISDNAPRRQDCGG